MGGPRKPVVVEMHHPYPWESEAVAKEVRGILDALDEAAPAVDAATLFTLQKIFYRRQYFHRDGRGHVIILLRAIMESHANGAGALVAPIVEAVSSAMRPEWTARGLEWIAAFDDIALMSILQGMRSLELFSEKSLGEYLGRSIQNRLWKHFGPDVAATPAKPKQAPKPPARVSRIPVIEKRVQLGLALLELKAGTRGSSKLFSRVRRQQYPDIDPMAAIEAARVARVYGQRPQIYRRVSWQALVELSSPSLSAAARRRFEARILAGEDVKGITIKRARGRLPNGRPEPRQQSEAIAA